MKTKLINLTIKVLNLILFLSSIGAMSDASAINDPGRKENVIKAIRSNDLIPVKRDLEMTDREKDIEDRMKLLKEANIPGSGEKLIELQIALESVSHLTTTTRESCSAPPASISRNNSPHSDNISISEIYSGTYVKGIATQVQQNYSGAGTIWLAAGVGNADTGSAAAEDTLIVYRSIDLSGDSYSEFARIPIGGSNKFYPEDALDMEIIELNNFTTYVYIVYSYTELGYTGNQRAGMTVIRSNPSSVNNFTLNFPGSAFTGNNYFRPRITSDIATYPVSPYITIVLTQDSASGINDHWYLTKYCRIINPFTTNPSITYIPKSIFTPLSPHPKDVFLTVQTDIAFINSGSGVSNKMVFILSGYPEAEERISVFKTDATLTGYPYYSQSYVFISSPDDNRELLRIASNGGPGQNTLTAIYSTNVNNSGNWDEDILMTNMTDGSEFWYGYSVNNDERVSRHGDVIGKRNSNGIFYFAYSNETGCAFRNYSSLYLNYYGSGFRYINSINGDYSTSFAYPKPSFRYINNDSCLSFFSTYNKLFSRSSDAAPLTMHLKLNIQGLYNNFTDLNNYDNEIFAYLANNSAPYNAIDSSINYFCSNNSSGFYTFNNAPPGNYFIVLKHKNMLETWSDVPYSFNNTSPVYADFRYSQTSAYGNNLIKVNSMPDRFAIFSGDTDHDGSIDLTDVLIIYNDAANFVSGNAVSDLTGEQVVDLNDLIISYNNTTDFVHTFRP